MSNRNDGLPNDLTWKTDGRIDEDALKLSYLRGRVTYLAGELESLKKIMRFNFMVSLAVCGSAVIYSIGWAWHFVSGHSIHVNP